LKYKPKSPRWSRPDILSWGKENIMIKTLLWDSWDGAKMTVRNSVYEALVMSGRQDLADEFMNRTNNKYLRATVEIALEYTDSLK